VRTQIHQTQERITVPRRPLKIGLLGPPEARVLDLAGPCEVFARVNEVLAEQQPHRKPGYQLELAAIDSSRSINCFGGLRIKALLTPLSWSQLGYAL
jgi:hypothetical protein